MDYLREVLPLIKKLDHVFCQREVAIRKSAQNTEELPDSRFHFLVKVITDEGGVFIHENAYAFWLGDWFCVVAEHCAEVAYHRDETLWVGMYERKAPPVYTAEDIALLAKAH